MSSLHNFDQHTAHYRGQHTHIVAAPLPGGKGRTNHGDDNKSRRMSSVDQHTTAIKKLQSELKTLETAQAIEKYIIAALNDGNLQFLHTVTSKMSPEAQTMLQNMEMNLLDYTVELDFSECTEASKRFRIQNLECVKFIRTQIRFHEDKIIELRSI
jgi:hypothetical protein